MGGPAAAVAAAAASIANAVKACGTIVTVEPEEFLRILALQESPLVVQSKRGVWSRKLKYLTSYKGLAFFCKSRAELELPENSQMVLANRIVMPEI